ncbi:Glucose-6-phosphate isomerase [Mycena indigotica]|uniref:Glucose-6-phosphate isomerase n=1 Tax=Mycena indigotica TaxID=2126181 RepID=A0A8H6S9D8_9AGAR|nr:Glucose-6-phosphate isomerase [Mycena indigotica]KAF7295243.1 Glucose-6-phosphate isomerase [Mycena indigotica]
MLQIGAQCSHSDCGEVDFLPILCVACKDYFCRFHATVDGHSCKSARLGQQAPATSSSPLLRCSAGNCGKPSLEAFIAAASDDQGRTPAKCTQCQQSFCAEHRHPKSHGCSEQAPAPPPKNDKARALLAKHFSSTKSTTATRTASKLC